MENNQIPWYHNGRVATADTVPEWAVGMIYRITKGGSIHYIGKKLLVSNRKVKIGKRAIAAERASRADGKAKTVKRVLKDTGWMQYNSSCKPLQKEIQEHPEMFHKEILHWCFSKKNMSLMETVEQIRHNVLWVVSYNDHIQNWYRHDTDRELYQQHLQRMKEKPRKPRTKKGMCI